jgi:hypothetical protein
VYAVPPLPRHSLGRHVVGHRVDIDAHPAARRSASMSRRSSPVPPRPSRRRSRPSDSAAYPGRPRARGSLGGEIAPPPGRAPRCRHAFTNTGARPVPSGLPASVAVVGGQRYRRRAPAASVVWPVALPARTPPARRAARTARAQSFDELIIRKSQGTPPSEVQARCLGRGTFVPTAGRRSASMCTRARASGSTAVVVTCTC